MGSYGAREPIHPKSYLLVLLAGLRFEDTCTVSCGPGSGLFLQNVLAMGLGFYEGLLYGFYKVITMLTISMINLKLYSLWSKGSGLRS